MRRLTTYVSNDELEFDTQDAFRLPPADSDGRVMRPFVSQVVPNEEEDLRAAHRWAYALWDRPHFDQDLAEELYRSEF
jgi:hypothetical protein